MTPRLTKMMVMVLLRIMLCSSLTGFARRVRMAPYFRPSNT